MVALRTTECNFTEFGSVYRLIFIVFHSVIEYSGSAITSTATRLLAQLEAALKQKEDASRCEHRSRRTDNPP